MSFDRKYPPGTTPHDLLIWHRFSPNAPNQDERSRISFTPATVTMSTENIHDSNYATFDGLVSTAPYGAQTTLNNMTNFTIECWIKPVNAGEGNGGRIFDKAGASFLGYGFTMDGTGGGLDTFVSYNAGASYTELISSTGITLNAWNHVAWTWTGSQSVAGMHQYINGVEPSYGTSTSGTGSRDSDASLVGTIGNISGATTRTFNGSIGNFRIWKKVLTPDQIGWIYNRTK